MNRNSHGGKPLSYVLQFSGLCDTVCGRKFNQAGLTKIKAEIKEHIMPLGEWLPLSDKRVITPTHVGMNGTECP